MPRSARMPAPVATEQAGAGCGRARRSASAVNGGRAYSKQRLKGKFTNAVALKKIQNKGLKKTKHPLFRGWSSRGGSVMMAERLMCFLWGHDALAQRTVQALLRLIEPVDADNAARLLQALNQVTLSGEMPSFGDAGARAGYIQKRFAARSTSVAAILLHPGRCCRAPTHACVYAARARARAFALPRDASSPHPPCSLSAPIHAPDLGDVRNALFPGGGNGGSDIGRGEEGQRPTSTPMRMASIGGAAGVAQRLRGARAGAHLPTATPLSRSPTLTSFALYRSSPPLSPGRGGRICGGCRSRLRAGTAGRRRHDSRL